MAGPVFELRMIGPEEQALVCPACLGRLVKYLEGPYFYYCPECRRNVMVVDGQALGEVA